ncbi:MAG: COX15/CtaA family protein [Candidatus Eisenbacteria bacterium]
MPSPRAFAVTSRLALTTTALMFVLIVIGSVVRTTGSGLACPDWPLCNGQWIPPMQFNVMIEWLHRLVALLVSLLLVATVAWIFAHREVRARLGGLVGLAVLLLFTQVVLGALTVWKLLDPGIVSAHLGVALMLFAVLLTIALSARARAEESPAPPAERGLAGLFGLATFLTFVQALLGGAVSTSGAGLACPDWPTCNGAWFPPLEGGVGLQMIHRWGAYALLAVMLLALARSRASADPVIRSGGAMLFALTLTQAMFGILNVLMGLPVWMSAVHLGTAAAMLAMGVALTFLAATPALSPMRASTRATA